MEFVTYQSASELARLLADQITRELVQFIDENERASLCLPGGSTPGPVFDLLAQADIAWEKVAVFLNDERWVDKSSPRSNSRLLDERFFVHKASKARRVALYAPALKPEERLDELCANLRPYLPISVLLLGMGEDMHTASLFPEADCLTQALAPDAPILMAMRAKAAQEPRITITAPFLKAAKNIHLMIIGEKKRMALENALTLCDELAPVRVVLDRAIVHWAP